MWTKNKEYFNYSIVIFHCVSVCLLLVIGLFMAVLQQPQNLEGTRLIEDRKAIVVSIDEVVEVTQFPVFLSQFSSLGEERFRAYWQAKTAYSSVIKSAAIQDMLVTTKLNKDNFPI